MAVASIVTVAHQQGVSNVPVRAGAQSFGPPQRGHVRFGFGSIPGRWCIRGGAPGKRAGCASCRRRRPRRGLEVRRRPPVVRGVEKEPQMGLAAKRGRRNQAATPASRVCVRDSGDPLG